MTRTVRGVLRGSYVLKGQSGGLSRDPEIKGVYVRRPSFPKACFTLTNIHNSAVTGQTEGRRDMMDQDDRLSLLELAISILSYSRGALYLLETSTSLPRIDSR